jgi:hypothetical protein
VQGAPVQFHTAVDSIVRTIQAKPEILGPEVKEVKAEPRQTEEKDEGRDAQQLPRGKAKRKRFACDIIPGCNKMFAPKKALDATANNNHSGTQPPTTPLEP